MWRRRQEKKNNKKLLPNRNGNLFLLLSSVSFTTRNPTFGFIVFTIEMSSSIYPKYGIGKQ
jgi:hypothetical protein